MGCKYDQHENAHHPSRNGISGKHNKRRDIVEIALMSDRLCNSERNADAIDKNQGEHAEKE